MKKLLISIILLLVVFSSAVYSQEPDEKSVLKEEVTVSSSNLKFDNLSLQYARLISGDLWLNLGVIDLSLSAHKNMPSMGDFVSKDGTFNGGLLLGIDKHKSLAPKLELIYGLNIIMYYSYINHTTDNPSIPAYARSITVNSFSPGVGVGLGVFYKINPSVLFGFEVNPSVSYSFINGRNPDGLPYKNRGIYFSINNEVARVSLKYRF
jgi:hypothetical protein